MAIEIAATGTAASLTIAVAIVGAVPTIVMHRRQGRKDQYEEGQRRQKLIPEEERIVLKHCYFYYHLGFPPIIWQLHANGTSIVQKRNPKETLGKRWEEAFKRRHPEVKTSFSKQLDFI
ncbi:hypothetical protein L873DRAFT_1817577 [Choiromyces venosus 120613-1]|uniref:HTH CENPB-type domain-containing protein n=1 Tax=Choiromyces venosus 120613-1 TaxID=1336337 RepID=A0A3N4J5F9_9PEZI|nr:hypothetical protein L873DRAFT_1817577 [Choiromyces venosus 120613-1]